MRSIRASWHPDHGSAWERDDPHRDEWLCYLDRETGDIRWLPNPNSMRGLEEVSRWGEERAVIGSDSVRFVEIPMLAHIDHHEIFGDFVRGLPPEVQAMNRTSVRLPDVGPGRRVWSIGGFLREVEETFPERDVRNEWHAYHQAALMRRAAEWYRTQGLHVEWSG